MVNLPNRSGRGTVCPNLHVHRSATLWLVKYVCSLCGDLHSADGADDRGKIEHYGNAAAMCKISDAQQLTASALKF